MGKVFIIDVEKCNGCYDCVMACNDENFKEDLDSFEMEHPSLGQFLLKVEEHLYGDPPRIKQYFLVRPCMHCQNAPCAQCCPVDALRINELGLVELDQDKCISCRMCVYACPYDSVFYNRIGETVHKCSGCSHLVRQGKEPRCVSACDRGAIVFGDREEFSALYDESIPYVIEDGMRPVVHYAKMPKN